MNFIEFESEQKLRGGFYTAPVIADFLTRWVRDSDPKSILEPSCGDGAFLEAIEQCGISSLEQVTACELNEEEAEKAASRTNLPIRMRNVDFLRWYLETAQNEEPFDAVVGNPPFIRYQYLPAEQQSLAERLFRQLNLPFTKHTNAWVPFVLASIRLLRPGGRLAMVIPSEIFHIPHAQALRSCLTRQCSKILLVDPEEIWFDTTLQGTVLLMAEKKQDISEESLGVAVVPVKSQDALTGDPQDFFRNAPFTSGPSIEGKWMPVFLSHHQRELIAELRAHQKVKRFVDVAEVDVGIVTGANKFFLVPDAVVTEYGLKKWAHPMFGRSGHVKGMVYTESDHAANKEAGLPANFLWFQEDQFEDLPDNVKEYLETGLAQNLQTRFKCRTRKPWFRVPSVYSTPIAMLKRAHHYPRLVLNRAAAYTTDTAYRIRPHGIEAESLVLGFINSLTSLSAEMEGRHYGGGVLELVPSEIERLLVPTIPAESGELEAADERFRSVTDHPEFLRNQDAVIFGKLGLSRSDQQSLHEAWLKLRDRRHRTPSSDGAKSAPVKA